MLTSYVIILSIYMLHLNNIKNNFKAQVSRLAQDGFHKIFNQIDQLGIKNSVDRMGLDKFINQCAYLAAGSGVVTGVGGALTTAIGIPIDMLNLITQQFRITLAIHYRYRGAYVISFEEFIKIVAASLSVEAGIAMTKTVMEGIAEKLLVKIGSKTAGRLIPIAGAVIGGGANYLYIKRMAEAVKDLQPGTLPVKG
jgi:hypothetical protein